MDSVDIIIINRLFYVGCFFSLFIGRLLEVNARRLISMVRGIREWTYFGLEIMDHWISANGYWS